MRKNLLLTCLLTLIATFGMAQSATWPIALTPADGLPGEEVQGSVYNYKSKVFTFDEAITTLRYTVVQTLCSTKLPNNAESYNGRMTWGPGFPYFAISELTVYDAEGNTIEYTPTSNAGHATDGSLANLTDGVYPDSHFHTTWEVGTIDDDYHYIELEFVEPVNAFSIEWRTRYGWTFNQPSYVGLTPGGESFWPMPEQELKVEKISTLEELAEPNGLFVIEGHVESWYDEARERTNIGGGFFEAPCLATREPSAFGVFTLIPVADAENTYKVEYINTDHYIIKKNAAGQGFIDWTMDIRKAMNIEFAANEEVEGDFTLTSLDGTLLIMQDAIMRMGCLENTPEKIAEFTRPFASNFSIYKADIKASTILYKLTDAIAAVEERFAQISGSLENYDEGQVDEFNEALATAKEVAANSDATAAEILSARNELNAKFNNYYALSLFVWTDSVNAILAGMEDGSIPTSSAPDWMNNTYPESYADGFYAALDNSEVVFSTFESLDDIDAAVEYIKNMIDGFWAAKISNVKNLPFRLGREEDGLPGIRVTDAQNVFKWESPTYYLTEEVDQLRFTVFKTKAGRTFSGTSTHFVCINEFELYGLDGQKIELTEDCFETNSIAPTDGKGMAGLCDGGINNGEHFHSQWDYNDYTEYDGSEYFYLDITLPEEIGGFKFIQYARGNGYDDVPVDFVFGYYGETALPEDVLFPDDYNAMRGAQVESVDEINDNGIYALYGLLGCSPEVGGDPEDGGFYSAGNRWVGACQSPCAFTIKSTGDGDGTYYIQSLVDGTYWKSASGSDGDYWEGGSTTIYKSQAAKVKIEPNNNDENLPFSFVIYEYVEESYRDIAEEEGAEAVSTQCPYVIAQDWGGNYGWFPVPSFDKNDIDGEGEWFIYKMSMDTPYSYWLGNMANTLANLGLVESNDPGAYKSLGSFPAALANAQAAAEAKDEAVSKAMINTLDAAIVDIENATTNPVVAGYYVIEANQPGYLEYQGVKKAIYAMAPHDGCVSDASYCEEYEVGWKTTPADLQGVLGEYMFELVPATEDDQVAVWIEDSLITEEQAKNAYYIKNVMYDKYITCSNPEDVFIDDKAANIAWWGIHLSLSETPQAFVVLQYDGMAFDIWMPGGSEYHEHENGHLCLHAQGHSAGKGTEGHIVFWKRSDANSLWNLRYIGEAKTSIEAPVVEGGEVVSTTYYTVDGVASDAPVNGVNIVKYVYSNGVVKTVKVVK